MKFLTLVPPLALATALALTPVVWAQTTVGSQTVSEADMPAVQTHCDELAAAAPAAGVGATPATPATPTPPAAGAAAPAEDAAAGAGAAAGAVAELDVAAITLEDCRAANLVD